MGNNVPYYQLNTIRQAALQVDETCVVPFIELIVSFDVRKALERN